MKRKRLEAFLAKHPDPYERYSLADIARAIGATRQFVHLHLPAYAAERERRARSARDRALSAFLRDHPGLLSPRWASDFVSIDEAAAATGYFRSAVRTFLNERGYTRRRRSPSELRQHKAEWQREREKKVLRMARCVVCKTRFAWTGGMEKRFRLGVRTMTCRRGCANIEAAWAR